MLYLLVTDVTAAEPHFPITAVLMLVLGFIAAASIGSIAWYNSRRPLGWEEKERPDVVPKVDKKEHPGLGEPTP